MKIIVDTQKQKDALLQESEYIHYLTEIDSDMAPTIMHIYLNPDMIEISGDYKKIIMRSGDKEEELFGKFISQDKSIPGRSGGYTHYIETEDGVKSYSAFQWDVGH